MGVDERTKQVGGKIKRFAKKNVKKLVTTAKNRQTNLGYGVPKEMEKELDMRYKELEVIVNRIKEAMKHLNGFNILTEPYINIYEVLAPPNPIRTAFGTLRLKVVVDSLLLAITIVLILFIGLPAISGFMRMPWKEAIPVISAFICIYFLSLLKRKLKVIP